MNYWIRTRKAISTSSISDGRSRDDRLLLPGIRFFTFYGLPLLLKEIDPEVSSLGNPAMPMKMPFGPEGFQKVDWQIPAFVQAVPGFSSMTTSLMKQTFEKKGVATVSDLRDACVEMDVDLVACQMTMDVFGFERDDFLDECNYGGAAAFLEAASDADVTLFI
jgi:peroxiredoxin family protein